MEFFQAIDEKLYYFLIVVGASLVIGLEQAKIHQNENDESQLFGTHRTFTFIGILGYILFIFPENYNLFILGGCILGLLLGAYYVLKIIRTGSFGLTSVILALIVYFLPPLFMLQPLWLGFLVMVVVLVLTELKKELNTFIRKLDDEEFITLAKFIVLSGIAIPLLPDTSITTLVPITPRELWVTVAVISGISYVSYLLQRYVIPNSGAALTGILGGIYSSTATTIVLARQGKQTDSNENQVVGAIMLATMAMYLRLLVLAFIFNPTLAMQLVPYLIMMALVAGVVGFVFLRLKSVKAKTEIAHQKQYNPLQLKLALIFALLFVGLSVITQLALDKFGSAGMSLLSWVVGCADIDPFLLNLFQGNVQIEHKILLLAILQAITSNNVLKAFYAGFISRNSARIKVILGFGIIIVMSLVQIAFVAIFE